MAAIYALLATALGVVCAALGLGLGLSWGARLRREHEALDAPTNVLAASPFGFGIVSVGNPEGDSRWGWDGDHTRGRWLYANRTLCGLLGVGRRRLHDLTLLASFSPSPGLAPGLVLGQVSACDGSVVTPAIYALSHALEGETPLYAVVLVVSRASDARALERATEELRRAREQIAALETRLSSCRRDQDSETRRALASTVDHLDDVTQACRADEGEEGSAGG